MTRGKDKRRGKGSRVPSVKSERRKGRRVLAMQHKTQTKGEERGLKKRGLSGGESIWVRGVSLK